VIKKRQP